MRYFAYGSNLSTLRLRARVPSATPLCVAALPRHELKFHKKGRDGSGKCDAWHTGNGKHRVVGVVFELAAADKPVLDDFEGLGVGYEEKWVEVVTPNGTLLEAFTYCALEIQSGLDPYEWYLCHVLTGAREHGLPTEYIQTIEAVPSMADPNALRHAREMRIYGG